MTLAGFRASAAGRDYRCRRRCSPVRAASMAPVRNLPNEHVGLLPGRGCCCFFEHFSARPARTSWLPFTRWPAANSIPMPNCKTLECIHVVAGGWPPRFVSFRLDEANE